jgi:hypothetical protein
MSVEQAMGTKITLRATPTSYRASAGDIRVEMRPYSLTPQQARELAGLLQDAAIEAERLPDRHDRHLNLLASCALCVAECWPQTDRLTYDEDED